MASSAADNSTVSSTATVASSTEPRINLSDDASTLNTPIVRRADLRLTQTESVDPVIAGSGAGNLTYVLTVANLGPSNASGVRVAADLTLPAGVSLVAISPGAGTFTTSTAPDGTWNVGNLAAGTSATLTVLLTASAAAADGAVISNAAVVSAVNETLLNAADDAVLTATSVLRQIDLQVVGLKSADPLFAGPGGEPLTHAIRVTNLGPSQATGVSLLHDFAVPAGVTLVSVTPSAGTSFANTALPSGIWTVGNLAVGDSAVLTYAFSADDTVTNGARIRGLATAVAADQARINPANDAALVSTTVLIADFGDAPVPYPTLLAHNGARHIAVGATLGANREIDRDGQPANLAKGDDAASGGEDGFVSQSLIKANNPGFITVNVQNVGQPQFLSAWLDFNLDGDWTDPHEQIAADLLITADGDHTIEFVAPPNTRPGTSIARFRISTVAGLNFTGQAPDGEVEDHAVTLIGGGNVTTEFISDPQGKGKGRLFITGDEHFNQIALDFGAGANPFANTLRLRGLDGTTIDGVNLPKGFGEIGGGVFVSLLGADDVVFINGGLMRGPITLDGGEGDDAYVFAIEKAKIVLQDSGGIDTLDFSEADKGVKLDLAKETGQSQSIGSGNTVKLLGRFEHVFGSRFNDVLKGNAADNTLIGGEGNDTLEARAGFDLLIGGRGKDKLVGGTGGNSLLIGGATLHDNNAAALLALLAEWASGRDLPARIENLTHGGGLNGAAVLTQPGTVVDDALVDTFKTSLAENLIFAREKDKLSKQQGQNVVKK